MHLFCLSLQHHYDIKAQNGCGSDRSLCLNENLGQLCRNQCVCIISPDFRSKRLLRWVVQTAPPQSLVALCWFTDGELRMKVHQGYHHDSTRYFLPSASTVCHSWSLRASLRIMHFRAEIDGISGDLGSHLLWLSSEAKSSFKKNPKCIWVIVRELGLSPISLLFSWILTHPRTAIIPHTKRKHTSTVSVCFLSMLAQYFLTGHAKRHPFT